MPSRNGVAPPAASARAYLRAGLPATYGDIGLDLPDQSFAMRFVGGLEEVLDPIVAMLDLLPQHFDLDIAPPELVALVGRWLGLDLPDLAPATRREIVRRATRVTQARGTRSGIQELLDLAFGDLELEVADEGGVTSGTDPAAVPEAAAPAFAVLCPPTATDDERAAIRYLVGEVKPVGVSFELRDRDEAAA